MIPTTLTGEYWVGNPTEMRDWYPYPICVDQGDDDPIGTMIDIDTLDEYLWPATIAYADAHSSKL